MSTQETALYDGPPRPKPGPARRVVQLRAAEHRQGVILCERLYSVMTHWNKNAGRRGRSEPCAQTDECEGCVKLLPKRWKGYLHVIDMSMREDFYIELTPGAALQLEQQLPKDGCIRGLRISVKRSAASNGRMYIDVALWLGDKATLIPTRPPDNILATLWQWGRE